MIFGPKTAKTLETARAKKPRLPTPAERERRAASIEAAIPVPVEIAGQWAWRILAIIGVLVVFGLLVIQLREIIIPFMVAILLAALLTPLVNALVRHKWPRALAVALAVVGTLSIIAGLIVVIVWQVRAGYSALAERSVEALDQFKAWLEVSPFQVSSAEFDGYIDGVVSGLNSDNVLTGALSVGSTAGHAIAGILLAIFAFIFLLIDGRGIWAWVTKLFPRRARVAVSESGQAGWLTLTTFVRVQVLVAAVDAAGIGLGAFIIGLFYGGFPLVIPITIAVFLGSFIPIVGAVVSGILAVFVALVFLGPVPALLMLGVVILVQQVEGHALQPFLIGAAVKVHPLAIVFAVAAGAGIAGIPGALFAVPLVATVNVMVKYIASGEWRKPGRPEVEDVVSPA